MNSPDLTLRDSVQRGLPALERFMLREVFNVIGPAPLRFILSDGVEMCAPGVTPVASILIRDQRTLLRLMVDPEVAFGEAYVDGRIQVEGDLARALEAAYRSWPQGQADHGLYQRLTSRWLEWWQENSPHGSRNNIHRHYDLGNEFYKLWLDSQMVYTCAYYPEPESTLDQAQSAKLDYVCRKLRLRHGETVVEAGCGWGALALHMARNYGVSVKAFNISREQIAFARKRADEEGLSGRVEFIEDDYRNLSGTHDVFVSVGMLEHVGQVYFADFGEVIHRSIGRSGRGLLHFIGRSYKADFSRWIRKHIFPGAYAPTLTEAMSVLEPYRYAVLDIENLRLHYARTVEDWLQRFEEASQQILEMFGGQFQRAWRLYLAGSIAGFRTGSLQLFQIVFAGPDSQRGAMTRAGLYSRGEALGKDSPCISATS